MECQHNLSCQQSIADGIGITPAADRDVTVVSNVANTQACLPEYNGVLNSAPNGTFGSPNTSGVLQCIPLAPRMTGVTLGYKF